MGILIKFGEGVKRVFINKEGKTQILPKFNLLIFVIIGSYLYLKTSRTPNSYTELIALSLLCGSLIGWGLKEVYSRDNSFYAWVGVLSLILGIYICWKAVANFYTVIF